MSISSLTTERVNKLLEQRGNKEKELNEMLKLSGKDLWHRDLEQLSAAWQDILEYDSIRGKADASATKKGKSKLTKVSRKRVSEAADGDYTEKPKKVAKVKENTSPKQGKVTSLATKSAAPKGAKEMHTAAFTSVNQNGSSILPKKDTISKVSTMMAIDDDDDFELLVRGIRQDEKPVTVDLLSPQTAMKPKKTIEIPGLKKTSLSFAQPKPRAPSKSKAPKRKIEEDDDSFAFMADKPAAAPLERRPARAAATKARAIVLTSDDVYDELDDEDNFEEDEDEE